MSAAESELDSLERRVADIGANVGELVGLLVEPGSLPRFVVAERLLPLGSSLLPHLIELLDGGDADCDLKGCVAYLGFEVGDRGACVSQLLRQIDEDGPWQIGGAQRLAEIRFPGTVSAIEGALARKSPSAFDEIVALLFAFGRAGGSLPASLRSQLERTEHWQVATALEELFPL